MTDATQLRGSGPIATCCGNHRDRCHFGQMHSWGKPWRKDGVLCETFHCMECDSECTAVDDDTDDGQLAATKRWDRLRAELQRNLAEANRTAGALEATGGGEYAFRVRGAADQCDRVIALMDKMEAEDQ